MSGANPYVAGPRFRPQAGLLVVLAHDRRHLRPARRVRADAAFAAR